MQPISTQNAPQAIGPYSQAIKANGLIFCSGQIPLNAQGEQAGENVTAQTHQVIKNIQGILLAAGSNLNRVVKSTVFLKDMQDFQAMNEVYTTYFSLPYPARSTVQVARLPKEALVEIEVIALAE